mmetsp:Transcript_24082/g.58056  ORF Transcript_24082/g.58056 Transcript_24082/m.58056 type:complete len:112 (-) Transcript_24082:286-621(-)
MHVAVLTGQHQLTQARSKSSRTGLEGPLFDFLPGEGPVARSVAPSGVGGAFSSSSDARFVCINLCINLDTRSLVGTSSECGAASTGAGAPPSASVSSTVSIAQSSAASSSW